MPAGAHVAGGRNAERPRPLATDLIAAGRTGAQWDRAPVRPWPIVTALRAVRRRVPRDARPTGRTRPGARRRAPRTAARRRRTSPASASTPPSVGPSAGARNSTTPAESGISRLLRSPLGVSRPGCRTWSRLSALLRPAHQPAPHRGLLPRAVFQWEIGDPSSRVGQCGRWFGPDLHQAELSCASAAVTPRGRCAIGSIPPVP